MAYESALSTETTQNRHPRTLGATWAIALALAAPSVLAQAGDTACVERLRKEGGPDAQNGIKVLDSLWSQAGTLVTMREAGGTVWVCIGYEDGATGC